MAHHRLGRSEDALKLLDQLRQLLAQDRWKDEPEAQAFLHEAKSLNP